MLQKYCACHEKVEPRHTNSCNCHANWSLPSNMSVTWNLQPFHGFSARGCKHRHHKAQNPCACHAKRIVSEPLQIPHACQCFCNPQELLRLPRILQRVEIPAPATQNALSTSKNVPSTWCFNDFDFQIDRARRCGANFAKLNFQKCSEHAAWCLFFAETGLARADVVQILGSSTSKSVWHPNRSRAQASCKFCRNQFPKVLRTCQFLTILTSESISRAGVVQILRSSTSKSAPNPQCFNFDFRIALARRRGAIFVHILGSRSFATPVFGTCFCEPSKPRNYGKTQHFAQFLPAKISHVAHLCCKTSLLSNIDAAGSAGNFQYSRKVELLNFLWWVKYDPIMTIGTHGHIVFCFWICFLMNFPHVDMQDS